jgi:tetratricopeptide (TPR) repeat protein
MADEKKCFVVMGFGEKTDYKTSRVLDLDKTYKHIIKKAVEEAGLECVRADEIPHSGTIDVPMYEQLLDADLVVADLSTSNLNAAYELGIRHALKPHTTIVIAEEQFSSPFDVNHIVIRKYRHDGKALDIDVVERFRGELKKAIQEIMSRSQTDSPVYTFLKPLNPPVRGSTEGTIQPPAAAECSAAKTTAQPENAALAVLMDQVHKAKANKDFLKAKSLLETVREIAPRESYVVQQLALVTYKSKHPDERKALEEARGILEQLDPLRSNDAETLGLWGAIHKRMFEISKERKQLDAAIFAYEKGYRLLGDYYNAINWAFLLNVRASLSEPADAIADFILARRTRADVLEICKKKLESLKESAETGAERYWLLATMAEAAIGLGDEPGSAQYLDQATKVAPESWMPDSTNEQLSKLRGYLADSPLRHLAA